MNYYLDTYGALIMAIAGFFCLFGLLAAYCFAADWMAKRLGLGPKLSNFIQGVSVFGAAISLFLLFIYVPDYLNDGRIETIYIVKKNDVHRLVVWFVREDDPAGMTTVYSHRIKSFDLDTGRQRGRLTLSRRYLFNDYDIYGPFDQFAWGYSAQNGMVYLDMFEAETIADEKAILARNPGLGDKVRLMTGALDKRFDPVTFGLYVYTANGDIYRINPDLKATDIKTLDRSPKPHDKETCAFCRQASQFFDIDKTTSGWGFANSSDDHLQFKNGRGQPVNNIDIHAVFGEDTHLYAAARIENEIWLFATMKGYTLSAVRTDAKTGGIIGRVDYF